MKNSTLIFVFILFHSLCYSQYGKFNIENRNWYLITELNNKDIFSIDTLHFHSCDSCTFFDPLTFKPSIRMDSIQTWMGRKNTYNIFNYEFDVHLDTTSMRFEGKSSLLTLGNYKIKLNNSRVYLKLKVVENVSKKWKKDKYNYQVILDRNKLILIKQN